MTEKQAEAYRLCVSTSRISLNCIEAVAAIMGGISSIEPGASVLDAGLPVPNFGKLDVLADDGRGRLIAVAFFNELDSKALSDALMRAEWVRDNRMLLEHIYGRPLPHEDVSIWIFAERVLPEASVMLRLIATRSVSAYLCDGLGLGDERWLVVRGDPGEPRISALNSAKAESDGGHKGPIRLHSVLSHEEVNDFFGAADDEITNSGAFPQE